eukprot:2633986-Alexandrium_andersonii.AAC.1
MECRRLGAVAQRHLVQFAVDSRLRRDAVCACGRLLAGDPYLGWSASADGVPGQSPGGSPP